MDDVEPRVFAQLEAGDARQAASVAIEQTERSAVVRPAVAAVQGGLSATVCGAPSSRLDDLLSTGTGLRPEAL
jgi:hypothetical protein